MPASRSPGIAHSAQCENREAASEPSSPPPAGPSASAPVQPSTAPAAAAPASAPVGESLALKWLKKMHVTVIGKGLATSWQEFSQQAPLEETATFEFTKIGGDRWYKFTFHDGSTMGACFQKPHGPGNGLELDLVNISPESDQSLY